MASRNVLYLAHQEDDGDALANKTITVTKPDGSALGVSLYEQAVGGSPVIAPATNAVGLKLLYANYADLDAEEVGRVKVSYSDAPSTTFDDALWPDPLDMFVDGMTRDRSLGGALTVTGLVTGSGGSSITRNADSFALTIQNTHTSWKGLNVLDGSGSSVLNTQKTSGGNICVSVNTQNANVPANTQFLVAASNARAQFTMADMAYENTATSDPQNDVSALRVVARQTSGNSYIRPVEFHILGKSGDNTLPKLAMEMTTQFSYAGNALDRTGGIAIQNLGDVAWPEMSTPQRADFAIRVGGDYYGYENAFLYQDTLGNSSATLFKVSKVGTITLAGNLLPVTDSNGTTGSQLGDFNKSFLTAYCDFFINTSNGTAAIPSIVPLAATTTGIWWPTSAMAASVGAAEKMRVDASGFAFAAGFRVQENSVATITPTQITGNTDNYNPTGLATASRLRLSTDASRNITGIVAQTAGTVLHLQNVGAQNIVLKHETTSTAANRLFLPSATDVTIPPGGAYSLIYDGPLTRWFQYVG